jgi:hypothetical protein
MGRKRRRRAEGVVADGIKSCIPAFTDRMDVPANGQHSTLSSSRMRWKRTVIKTSAEIAALFPFRTPEQCAKRWHEVLGTNINPADRRMGLWREDEDIKLKNGVETLCRSNWVAVAALVPGRDEKQCCKRWHHAFDPSIDRTSGSKDNWTAVEDEALNDAVQMCGSKNWEVIAELVPGRTRKQCSLALRTGTCRYGKPPYR